MPSVLFKSENLSKISRMLVFSQNRSVLEFIVPRRHQKSAKKALWRRKARRVRPRLAKENRLMPTRSETKRKRRKVESPARRPHLQKSVEGCIPAFCPRQSREWEANSKGSRGEMHRKTKRRTASISKKSPPMPQKSNLTRGLRRKEATPQKMRSYVQRSPCARL